MKIVHVTYSDSGGAGLAAVRLHKGLLQVGIDSEMLVVKNTKRELPKVSLLKEPFYVRLQRAIGYWIEALRTKPQRVYRRFNNAFKKFEAYSLPWSDFRLEEHSLIRKADIIHFHWVAGMVNYETFFKNVNKPIIWTLHDMNPFLGGLHFEFDSNKNLSHELQQLEAEIMAVKFKEISKLENMRLIAPSNWMLDKSINSEMFAGFRHHHIPYGLESNHFNVRSKEIVKSKKRVGFAAESLSNKRKGYEILRDYLNSDKRDTDIEFVCAGKVDSSEACKGTLYLGRIESEPQMAEFYQSLDAFLICSLEDNLPNVIIEALYCGVPILGFKRSGIVEMVEEGANGFLSDETNANGIDQLITQFKESSFDSEKISSTARQQYAVEKQVNDYLKKVVY